MKKLMIMKKLFLLTSILGLFFSCGNTDKNQQYCEKTDKDQQQNEINLQPNLGIWEIGNFIDEFGDKTGRKYIATTINGFFSDLSNDRAELLIKFVISNEMFLINLYKHGRFNVSDQELFLRIRDKNNDIHGIELFFLEFGINSYAILDNENKDLLINLLKKGGELRFSGLSHNVFSQRTDYTFNFNADYFQAALNIISDEEPKYD